MKRHDRAVILLLGGRTSALLLRPHVSHETVERLRGPSISWVEPLQYTQVPRELVERRVRCPSPPHAPDRAAETNDRRRLGWWALGCISWRQARCKLRKRVAVGFEPELGTDKLDIGPDLAVALVGHAA